MKKLDRQSFTSAEAMEEFVAERLGAGWTEVSEGYTGRLKKGDVVLEKNYVSFPRYSGPKTSWELKGVTLRVNAGKTEWRKIGVGKLTLARVEEVRVLLQDKVEQHKVNRTARDREYQEEAKRLTEARQLAQDLGLDPPGTNYSRTLIPSPGAGTYVLTLRVTEDEVRRIAATMNAVTRASFSREVS